MEDEPAAVHYCRLLPVVAEEELPDHSPTVHIRGLHLDHEPHAISLDRNEIGALLATAGIGFGRRSRHPLYEALSEY